MVAARPQQCCRMTAVKLREWRGVKPVPGPSGAAISTRLRTTPGDDSVLDAAAGHLAALVVQTWHMFAARGRRA